MKSGHHLYSGRTTTCEAEMADAPLSGLVISPGIIPRIDGDVHFSASLQFPTNNAIISMGVALVVRR